MKRLFPADAAAATEREGRGPESAEDANEAVERKFHGTSSTAQTPRWKSPTNRNTLEEVFALKQILQEFLAEPPAKPAPATTNAPEVRPTSRRMGQQEPSVGSEPRPNVRASRSSERMLRQSLHFEPDFQARMSYYMRKNQLKKDQIQAAVDEKTQEHLKLAPTINQRSKRIHRSVHHLHAWEHEKQLKLEELRQAERRREVEEVTSAPKVSRVSRRLSLNRRGDLAECRVEDRLHLLGLIYEYQQEERQIEAAKRSRGGDEFRPRLAPHSSKLLRNQSDSVHERLHELSKRPHQQLREQDYQHSPKRTKPKVTVEAAIQRLTEIGELYRAKRVEMAQHQEHQLKEMQLSQKLSSKSRLLAEKARSKANEEHLRKCPCCRQPEEDERPEAQATINVAQAAAIYERQRQWLARKEQKCQEERERREVEEAAALAFRNPQYRAAWDPLVGENDDDRHGNDVSPPGKVQQHQQRRANGSFFEKSTKWAEDREQQLVRERQVWEEINLRDCTFKPKLCSAPPRRKHPKEATPRSPTPRSVLQTLDQGFFSRTNLRTPMLDAEDSDVSSDDCMSEEEGGVDGALGCDEDGESHVVFIDQGKQICSR